MKPALLSLLAILVLAAIVTGGMNFTAGAWAQTAPSTNDVDTYNGLLRAAHNNDVTAIRSLSAAGAELEIRDSAG